MCLSCFFLHVILDEEACPSTSVRDGSLNPIESVEQSHTQCPSPSLASLMYDGQFVMRLDFMERKLRVYLKQFFILSVHTSALKRGSLNRIGSFIMHS